VSGLEGRVQTGSMRGSAKRAPKQLKEVWVEEERRVKEGRVLLEMMRRGWGRKWMMGRGRKRRRGQWLWRCMQVRRHHSACSRACGRWHASSGCNAFGARTALGSQGRRRFHRYCSQAQATGTSPAEHPGDPGGVLLAILAYHRGSWHVRVGPIFCRGFLEVHSLSLQGPYESQACYLLHKCVPPTCCGLLPRLLTSVLITLRMVSRTLTSQTSGTKRRAALGSLAPGSRWSQTPPCHELTHTPCT
jgi:hypothetical protein